MAESKYKNWVAVLWLENMRPDWEEVISGIIQFPYAYCIHDKDLDTEDEDRKPHVHLIISYGNNTTYKHIMSVYHMFDKDPLHPCVNTCERILNIRYMYNYLIHDTEDCRKKHKFLYPESCRIEGNNFDIGLLEQFTLEEKYEMILEICRMLDDSTITTYNAAFNLMQSWGFKYVQVFLAYSGHFDRYTRGIYLREKAKREQLEALDQAYVKGYNEALGHTTKAYSDE